jgi:3-hydroxyisobutyrate dehydrogenase
MTTSSPSLAQRIADAAQTKQISMLDAPVSGGDIGAREARLSIMVGGEAETLAAAKPLLLCMGKTVVYQGTHGSGQHCKMANQIAIAANMMGVCEAIHYAQRAGLDAQTVLDSISGGAAASWSLSNLAPRMLQGNFAPGFYVKHFRKDLGIALDEVRRLGLNMPGLSNAARLYQELDENLNGGDQGTQALLRWYVAQA